MNNYDIASQMNKIMKSSKHRAIHSNITKTASLNKKSSKKVTAYERCINNLAKISEILDNSGFSKSATLAILTLDSIIKEAKKYDENNALIDWGDYGGSEEFDSLLYKDDSLLSPDPDDEDYESSEGLDEYESVDDEIEYEDDEIELSDSDLEVFEDEDEDEDEYFGHKDFFTTAQSKQRRKRSSFRNLLISRAAKKEKAMNVRTFVIKHGPFDEKKNAKIFNLCKKMQDDEKCQGFMKKMEKLKNLYLEDRAGGKDFDDSMLEKVMVSCEKYCAKNCENK